MNQQDRGVLNTVQMIFDDLHEHFQWQTVARGYIPVKCCKTSGAGPNFDPFPFTCNGLAFYTARRHRFTGKNTVFRKHEKIYLKNTTLHIH